MKGFYLLLGAVALIGGGVLWYGSQAKPERGGAGNGGAAPLPVAATDGFRGYTLGSDSAPVEIREYSDFECPFCAAFATVQMPVIREQLIATGKVRWRFRSTSKPRSPRARPRTAPTCARCTGSGSPPSTPSLTPRITCSGGARS